MLHIICFGNELHGDDGFGVEVYHQLAQQQLTSKVRLYNGGIAGLNAVSLFEHCEHVILVDAITSQGNVGKLIWYSNDQLPDFGKVRHDSHGVGLPYLLRAVELMVKPLPVISLLGVEIERIQVFSPSLSTIVSASVNKAVNQLLKIINSQIDPCFVNT